jgi:hypothetical protein
MSVPDVADDSGWRAGRTAEDLALFIGPRARRFLDIPAPGLRGRFAGICWTGLFLPTPWFLYRKMYGWAATVVLVPWIAGLILPVARIPLLGVAAVLGGCGRPLYRHHARRLIAAIRRESATEAELRSRIGRAGGVSVAGAWIGAVIVGLGVAIALVLLLRHKG